jgi:phosphoribosylformylglycinamidine synthase I
MKAAVIIFPGSNCDHDAVHVCEKVMGWSVVPVWHESASLGGVDLVILPGGFAHGDYLRCGAIARFSPVMDAVRKHAKVGGLVAGFCNGFQILVEAGLLPGALLRNHSLQYRCQWIYLRCETSDSPFSTKLQPGQVLRIPIGHGEGSYFAPPDVLDGLRQHNQVLFRYCAPDGTLHAAANPNGSLDHIAGIVSEGRNILGMMPHPERGAEDILGGSDGKLIFDCLNTAYAEVGW